WAHFGTRKGDIRPSQPQIRQKLFIPSKLHPWPLFQGSLPRGSLARENSAYRFVEGQIAEITSKAEIEAVEMAIEAAGPYAGVSSHLTSALALMSDRTSPDYRNSIKESICAVESLAKQIAKKPSATLGVVLNELERTHALHPALKSAFSSLYGYTSNAQGIRHAPLDEPTLSKSDARFILVCCSALVN
ncbi:TPA: hypothetical protein Q4A38_05340, partial [Synechococcus sp. WH 5701]|uniref:hypothetical protein n=1 Tax=Synechococcus sp. WH 5701 TaxID=69042 RepID=UPI003C64AD27